MNYKSLQVKLSRRGIKMTLSELRDRFPEDCELTDDQIIAELMNSQVSLAVSSPTGIQKTAESLDVSLSFEEAQELSNNLKSASTGIIADIEMVENAILAYVEKRGAMIEARAELMVNRVRQKINEAFVNTGNNLSENTLNLANEIKEAENQTRANFRQSLQFFDLD